MNTPPARILIVEDESRMRAVLKEYLQAAFPEVAILEAADAGTALESCRRQAIDLVVTDIGLPGMNGIELTAQIRASLPDTAVIVMSQQNASIYADKALAAGARTFVPKDRIRSELLAAVSGVLGIASWERPQ